VLALSVLAFSAHSPWVCAIDGRIAKVSACLWLGCASGDCVLDMYANNEHVIRVSSGARFWSSTSVELSLCSCLDLKKLNPEVL
jgi:hypothetical protein